jgi:hypothetical protein
MCYRHGYYDASSHPSSADGRQRMHPKRNADPFRQYAADCRRLAQRASEKDKAVLMQIAGDREVVRYSA